LWIACAGEVVAQQASSFNDRQIASCPAIFPILKGERSLVVPTVAPQFAQVAPHPIAESPSTEWNGNQSLLRQKLAERERLQKEISQLQVATNAAEKIRVHVRVMELDRTKLRQLGVDFAAIEEREADQRTLSALSGKSINIPGMPSTGVDDFMFVSMNNQLLGIFDALEKRGVTRVLASPTVVTIDGQEAEIKVGSQLAGPNQSAVPGAPQEFGTQLRVKPTLVGNGKVRLEVRPRVCQPNYQHTIVVDGRKLPSCRIREIDTAWEGIFGESFLLTGLVEERTESRRVSQTETKEEIHEVALVVVATPELVR
jgi:pilus assembly protein CpaC